MLINYYRYIMCMHGVMLHEAIWEMYGLLKVPAYVGATPPWPTIAKATGGSI